MRNDRPRLFLASLFLVAAWWTWKGATRASSADAGQGADPLALNLDALQSALSGLMAGAAFTVQSAAYTVQDTVTDTTRTLTGSSWTPPDRAAPYLPAIYAAEDRHGMPRNLLARLLFQESRYRPEIIDGRVKSGAGAVGIAQIVPKWHPDAKPLDPLASIDYAAQYLAQLKQSTGSWSLALAAYNWGPGNLKNAGYNIAGAPKETRDYVAQITGDVPEALA